MCTGAARIFSQRIEKTLSGLFTVSQHIIFTKVSNLLNLISVKKNLRSCDCQGGGGQWQRILLAPSRKDRARHTHTQGVTYGGYPPRSLLIKKITKESILLITAYVLLCNILFKNSSSLLSVHNFREGSVFTESEPRPIQSSSHNVCLFVYLFVCLFQLINCDYAKTVWVLVYHREINVDRDLLKFQNFKRHQKFNYCFKCYSTFNDIEWVLTNFII